MTHADMSYLERIVVKPTWKQILLELVDRNRIDPWDVDIVRLSDEFMAKVREMQKLDLSLHANVILASAILLKYKSDYLKAFTAPPITMMPEEPVEQAMRFSEIPELSMVARIPPRRQVTVSELMAEMEKVIRYESDEIKRAPRGSITEIVDLNIQEDDIEKRMEEIMSRIKTNVDETGFATFSSVLKEKTSMEIVYTLLSILHLAQNQVIDIRQEKLFGEILICMLDGKENNGKEAKTEKIEMTN